MLDGRVLEASQVEYKPFGKPPLKREVRLRICRFSLFEKLLKSLLKRGIQGMQGFPAETLH